jgi:REP element-mobilizing transposase RayT
MPDHIHLFVSFGDETNLSMGIKSLKNYLSKCLRALGEGSPHFQKGSFDHLMRSEDSYKSKWQYVLQNRFVTDS